jgi:hypothetical protein
MKIALKRKRFQCVEEIKKNVTAEANEIPSEVLGDCFVKLSKKSLKIASLLRGIATKENKIFSSYFIVPKSHKFIVCPRIILLLQIANEGLGCVLVEDLSVICLV